MPIVKNIMVRAVADFTSLVAATRTAENAMRGLRQSADRNLGTGAASGVTTLTSSLKGLGTAMVAIGAAVIGLKTFDFIGDATNQAIKLDAMMGALNARLGEAAQGFTDWADAQGKALGLSRSQIALYGNTYSNMLSAAATSEADLADRTEKLLKASAIIRTKTGMQQEEISQRVRSALNMEADGADELGVNVRATAVEQSAAFKQMAGGVDAMSKLNTGTQKAILYQYLLDEVTKKYGVTVADNAANKQALFIASLDNLKTSIGSAFIPIFNIVIPALTTLVNWIDLAAQKVSYFFSVLLGSDTTSATKSATNVTSAYKNQSTATGGLTDAQKKLNKALENNLAAFDQINTLSTGAANALDNLAGAGGVPTGGVAAGVGPQPVITPKFDTTSLDKLATTLKPLIDLSKTYWQWFKDMFKEGRRFWLENGDDINAAIEKILGGSIISVLAKRNETIFHGFMVLASSTVHLFEGLSEILIGFVNRDWTKMHKGMEEISVGTTMFLTNKTQTEWQLVMDKVAYLGYSSFAEFDKNATREMNKFVFSSSLLWDMFITENLEKPFNKFDGHFTESVNKWSKTFGSVLTDINKQAGTQALTGKAGAIFDLALTKTVTPRQKGGITKGPSLALIGEAGTEVVAPLTQLQDYMAGTITNAIATAVQFASGGQQAQKQQTVDLQLDGRTVARLMKPYLDQEDKRIGTNIRYAPTITTPPARFG